MLLTFDAAPSTQISSLHKRISVVPLMICRTSCLLSQIQDRFIVLLKIQPLVESQPYGAQEEIDSHPRPMTQRSSSDVGYTLLYLT